MSCPFAASRIQSPSMSPLPDTPHVIGQCECSSASITELGSPMISASSSESEDPCPRPPVSYWRSRNVPVLRSMPFSDFIPDAVLIFRDGDFCVADCNEKAATIFGFPARLAMIGQPLDRLIPEEYRPHHHNNVLSVFMSMRPHSMSQRRMVCGCRYDGSEFEVSIELSPSIIQPNETDLYEYEKIVTCVCRDMTEYNRLMTQVNEANRKNELTEQFLRLINHEVRTSLHAVQLAAQQLHTDVEALAPGLSQSMAPSLDLLTQGVSGMNVLLNNILDFQLIKSGEFPDELGFIDWQAMFQSLSEEHRSRIETKQQFVLVDVAQPGTLVYSHTNLIAMIVRALFDNALRHTPPGTRILLSTRVVPRSPPPLVAEAVATSMLPRSIFLARSRTSIPCASFNHDPHNLSQAMVAYSQSSRPRTSRARTSPPSIVSALSDLSLVSPRSVANTVAPASFAPLIEPCFVEIRVSDSGAGLSAAAVLELEQETLSVDGSSTRATSGGIGLGFKIASLCARKLNAQLKLDTVKYQRNDETEVFHTNFVLTFEAAAVRARSNVAANETQSESTSKIVPDPPLITASPTSYKPIVDQLLSDQFASQRSSMRILLVDDNAVNIKVLKQCLTKRGFHSVSVATDGCHAVEASLSTHYDLVLMDLEMPLMDGITATRQIYGNSANPNNRTPIVALTANATASTKSRCKSAGMDLYFTKPLKPDLLMLAVATCSPFDLCPARACPQFIVEGESESHAEH